ncbi:MAG: Fe-S cluster assembly protein SufD [Pseudomonadota bacterium]
MNAPVRIDLKDVSSFPSRRVESWKYTDLNRWLREAPEPSSPLTAPVGGPFTGIDGDEITFGNGVTAEGSSSLLVEVEEGTEKVLKLRFVSGGVGGHEAQIHIVVYQGARLLLLESHEGEGSYVANNRISLSVSPECVIDRVVVLDEPAEAISITTTKSTAPMAAYSQTVLTTGAKLQRYETHFDHFGDHARAQLDGVYALDASRRTDMTSVVRHRSPNGVTSQLTKGVVRDTARGVFQGKIVVERGADGTDARMGHHALILGERAEVDAKPELEIYADDVQCAHGNTVGNLDESALFYMQQRGIPADEARALLTQAFLFEVVDRIAHEGAREVVRAWLTARL